jgi:hypothetical protein
VSPATVSRCTATRSWPFSGTQSLLVISFEETVRPRLVRLFDKFVAGDAAGFGRAKTVVVATSVMDPESDAGYPQELCPHPVAMRERVAGSWDRHHQKGPHARSRCSSSGCRCFPFTRRERTGLLPRPQGLGCRNRSQSPQRRTGQCKPPLTSLLGFSSRNPRRRLAF